MSIRNELLERILSAIQNQGGGTEGPSTVVNTINDFPNGFDADFVFIGSPGENESYVLGQNLDMQGRTFQQLTGSTVTMRADSVLGYTIDTQSTAPLFSGDQVGLVVRDIGLNAPNGSFFDFTKTAGFGFVIFKDANFKNCTSFGSVADLNYFALESRFVTTISGNTGLSFSGNIGNFIGSRVEVNSFGGTLVDFGTAVFEQYEISGLKARTQPGNVIINALPNDGNLAANGFGLIYNNSDIDGNGAVNGISPTDKRTKIYGNLNLPDSYTIGTALIDNDAAPATVIQDGVWVDLVGTATYDPSLNARFKQFGDNGLECEDLSPGAGQAVMVVSATGSGFSNAYEFAIFIDRNDGSGFVQAGVPSKVEIGLFDANIPINAPVGVVNGYKYKVRVRGVGTTTNINIVGLSLVVSK